MYTPDTPDEYEPPMFCMANPDDLSWFVDAPLTKTVGSVTTPYHQFSTAVYTTKHGWEREEDYFVDAAHGQREGNTLAQKNRKKTSGRSKAPKNQETTEKVPAKVIEASATAAVRAQERSVLRAVATQRKQTGVGSQLRKGPSSKKRRRNENDAKTSGRKLRKTSKPYASLGHPWKMFCRPEKNPK